MPIDHGMAVPRLAIVYTWMRLVLVSIDTDELCETLKLTIARVRQTLSPKEAHRVGQNGVTTGIVIGICTTPK